MKRYLASLFIAVALVGAPLATLSLTGCGTPVNERVHAVNTLKAVGHSAEGVVEVAARLYAVGQLSPEKTRAIMDFYDQKWQPAFRLAVAAAQSDPSSVASPDLLSLLAQLSAMIPTQPTS